MSELSENVINQMINSLDNKELIVLKFTAEWCGPCKLIKNDCETFKTTCPDSIKYFEIDIDDSIELFIKLKKYKMLSGVPAILAYNNEIKDPWYIPHDSVIGANKQQLTSFFQRCFKYVN